MVADLFVSSCLRVKRLGAIALLIALASCADRAPAPEEAPRANIVADWPTVPEDAAFGAPSGVAVDGEGRIFVLHRAGREWGEVLPSADDVIEEPTVFVFARNGRLLDEWGAGQFVMPHGISIDAENRVWITDVVREQVFRFSPGGTLELVLGERGVSGSDAMHFGKPSDIAFDGDRVLISDGYDNARIAVFDRRGDFIEEYGSAGNGPGEFDLPHAVAVDEDFIYVADRENARVQVLDKDTGAFVGTRGQKATGHPYGLAAMGGGWLAVVEGRDRADRSGAILRIYDPEGGLYRAYDAGLPGNGSLGHDLALGTGGALYMTDVYGDRVIRIDISRMRDGEEAAESANGN
ncbi:peptidyl-alpha-hydroxyglycine alpha-amidating lyase family protein [Qipengyuania sp. MTN3-11]|uniref:peptidyl-alpha-hydroxyglycine alpha-amidating lyase family protein n=1 Tax=Qipengyuania sp. MTN3-11 TaxID=3056557 RepID=UPI0036F39DEF